MRYGVEILGTLIKDTKVLLYGTNFLKFRKKILKFFFPFQFEKVSTIQTYLSVFYLSFQNFNSISYFLRKLGFEKNVGKVGI